MEELLLSYQKAINVNIITSITNSGGEIIYVNDKFCEVSKYSREELLGQNHRIVNSNFHEKNFFVELWKDISTGKTWHGEIKNRAKDGSHYWVDTVILPMTYQNERHYLSLRTIITRRKELEQKRLEYLNSLEYVLKMLSHKTRKPIVTILGLSQFNFDRISEEDFKKVIEYLQYSANELEQLTREFTTNIDQLKKSIEDDIQFPAQ